MQMYEKIVISTKKILSFWYFSLLYWFFGYCWFPPTLICPYKKKAAPNGAAF